MQIRPYEARDAEVVARIFLSSVRGVGPAHYSPEQVTAWASLVPSAAAVHARASDGRLMLVAVDEADSPLAFIDLEADGLYEAVEAAARSGGIARLYSEASEAALRFFRKRGFVMLHRRDLKIGGVAIHNFVVEKPLNQQCPARSGSACLASPCAYGAPPFGDPYG
jgi:putative acetyltransferase